MTRTSSARPAASRQPRGTVLNTIHSPADLRELDAASLTRLCAEIRDLLVSTVSQTGGHLGPNLGAVELTIALHRIFDSPTEPILFDVGHQAYVHKILTGRAEQFDTLRRSGGLSGYPNRAESLHDWIENSHASTALSYADGMAKAFALRGEDRPVVAVVGDGALTGGMCWEALNNIAASDRRVVIVVNDNGRSYLPTIGGLGRRLAALRVRGGYERMLGTARRLLPPGIFDVLHAAKSGMKDLLAPQGMFADLGVKYVGPLDGHDIGALEDAFRLARAYPGPVLVHCVTAKGHGYPPAERNDADRMHQSPPFDRLTGRPSAAIARRGTDVFADALVRAGERRADVVAVTAAMCHPTGLADFRAHFPERCFDVGIAEQHAVTSAAGLAMAGMHPVVAIYATFLNRAFDQVLMDVALHRLPVTFVLDRAGLTGDDGPSHNGMWDLAVLGVVPGLRIAAPRDEPTLREEFDEALEYCAGPTVLRFSKTALDGPIPAVRRIAGTDVLDEDAVAEVDVLLVAIGSTTRACVEAAAVIRTAGFSCRVVDPRWVLPMDDGVTELSRDARLVVTVEDGVAAGGAGARWAQACADQLTGVPARSIGLPTRFLPHAPVAQLRDEHGLTAQHIGRRVVEWCARHLGATGPGPLPAEPFPGSTAGPAPDRAPGRAQVDS